MHQNAVGLERLDAVGVEALAEQAFGWSDRVGGIDDQYVDRLRRRVLHPLNAVAEVQFGARIVIGYAQFGEILLGQACHPFVDFHLHGGFHFGVLEHFAQRAAVASADNDHALGRRMAVQRRVRHHLVVEKIVASAHHGAAVDRHQVTEGFGTVDVDRLIGRGLAVYGLAELQRKRESGVVVRLGEPGLI